MIEIKPFPPNQHTFHGKYPKCWTDDGLEPIRALGAYDGEAKVGGLCLFRIELYHAGVNHQGLGIGGVWVDEAARGEGVATQLVQAAVEFGRTMEFSVMLLYAHVSKTVYSRLGFHSIRDADLPQPLYVFELGPFKIGHDASWHTWPEAKF